jgi:lipopolysaccharide biosynthesis glycosyltransferase
MAVHAFTSFSLSYLNRARVLASSLRRQHPDWVIWAVLTDKDPEGFRFNLTTEDFDRMVTAEELFGELTNRWLFGHDIVEACTAVKGRALLHILNDPTADKVVYFDPDIAVFNSMDEVIHLLDTYAVVLTPHQLEPEPATDIQAIQDNEIASLDFGIFNLGFVAVNRSKEAQRFAQWWADRLFEWCHDRRDIGIFVDQKWCNLVPCFFDDVKVLRDPGYNVASWNLSQRTMHFDAEGEAQINGKPLRFYHFTKLGPIGDTMTRRYAADNTEIYELWWWYRHEVARATDPGIPKGWWYYGTFDNGVAIEKKVRELFRERQDLRKAFRDPFETGPGTFYEWLKL